MQDRKLTIEIRDFGGGLKRTAQQPIETVGLGIGSMQERLQQLGGTFDLSSSSGGTLVRGTIPLDATTRLEKDAA